MKKAFFFDVLALVAVLAGFFVLFSFTEIDNQFWDKLKNADRETLIKQTEVENAEFTGQGEGLKEEESVLDRQSFTQPAETEFVNCYCYSVLTEEEREIYREIYAVLKSQEGEATLSTLDVVQMEKVFNCVLNDHPQFYYVEGYTYTSYEKDDVISKITFRGTYSKTKEECEVTNQKIENYVNLCFAGIKPGMSDYDKVKYLYEYIIEGTEYNLSAEDNQNICSVFLEGESVCMGYARAMQYLLLKQDILCTIVNGTAGEGEEHAWNLLLLDGQYYHLDVTWGDDSYTVSNEQKPGVGMVNYSFFCVTTEEILRTHTIDNRVKLPECVSYENNYYVKEGYYFESFDLEKLSDIFKAANESGKGYVEIKCMDEVVYRQIYEYLIEEQHVFEYLADGMDTVSYYDGEELLLLEFWLK